MRPATSASPPLFVDRLVGSLYEDGKEKPKSAHTYDLGYDERRPAAIRGWRNAPAPAANGGLPGLNRRWSALQTEKRTLRLPKMMSFNTPI